MLAEPLPRRGELSPRTSPWTWAAMCLQTPALPSLELSVSVVLLGPCSSCCARLYPQARRGWPCPADGGVWMRGGVTGSRACPGQWSLPLGLSCRGGLLCGSLKVGGSVGYRAPPSCVSPALPDCLRLLLSWVHPAGARGTPATEGRCGVLPSQLSPRRSPLGEAPVHPAGRGTCPPCPHLLVALRPPTELHGGAPPSPVWQGARQSPVPWGWEAA